MKRLVLSMVAASAVAACQPAENYGGGGSAGFDAPVSVSSAPLGAAPDVNRTSGVQASPTNSMPAGFVSSGISNETDFNAVSQQISLEDDAARIAQQRAAYTVVQPTALPSQPANVGPNIVQYALNAPNRKGQAWYSRFMWQSQGRFERNCAAYSSADEAQRDFLARGGPERNPGGLDPDGDGFACGWDPAPFRQAAGLTN
ncbi:hypothetical protein BVG79_02100 [Ketogulonicigenium robustum]|uniref:Excalibur calcium-binding domain-containing protein n=1 Tax=Ketogulonicigenium robustum TaxID=92947 RepID=A0A1W6P285_9RHOB|nr:excalibur calcium-binding domain-containing protein [Ketogulonicigenium robustum]ARO15440.1 hypothetical protein BVG79_02100 [Ketogulonicigenium robustum]